MYSSCCYLYFKYYRNERTGCSAAFTFRSWNEIHPDDPLCYTLKTAEERDACYHGRDPNTVQGNNNNTVKYNPRLPSSLLEQQKQKPTTINSNFLTYKNSNHGLTIQYPANWDKDELADGGEYPLFSSIHQRIWM